MEGSDDFGRGGHGKKEISSFRKNRQNLELGHLTEGGE